MADVFISYSEKSAGELASRIADALENAGISCWYARRDVPVGSSFVNTIVQEIENCKVFLVILDKQSNSSQHVANEVAIAFRGYYAHDGIVIIPLRVEECQLGNQIGYYLAPFQYFDACPPTEERIQDLTYQIAAILGRERSASSPPPKNARAFGVIKGLFNRILNR